MDTHLTLLYAAALFSVKHFGFMQLHCNKIGRGDCKEVWMDFDLTN